jgi:phospholipid/cholesterol/gamma-HCH transport system substrate-binding protein
MSSSAKVGLTVLIALAALTGAYILLQGGGPFRRLDRLIVQFENAQGITQGTEVRLSGVRIGEVVEVALAPNRRANVTMAIEQKYRNAVGPRDTITIATGGLLPTPYIEIIPTSPHDAPPTPGVIPGQSAVTTDDLLRRFNDLMPEAQKLVHSLTVVSDSLNRLVGDPAAARSLKNTAANLEAASAGGKALVANLEVASARGRAMVENLADASNEGRPRVARSLQNLEAASASFARTSEILRRTVAENRPQVGQTLEHLSEAMASLQALLDEVRGALGDEALKKGVSETVAELRQMVENLRQTSANLSEATGSLRDLTGDPRVQEDLRATLTAARTTMEQAAPLFRRLNRLVGGADEGVIGARERLRGVSVRGDLSYRTSPGRARLDLEATLPRRDGFYRAGVYDFSEQTRLNLQLGLLLGTSASARFGLHASRLGLGLDLGAPRRPWLEADLYGLEDTRLDMRAAGRLNRDLDLILGVEDLFGDNAPNAGVRWRF